MARPLSVVAACLVAGSALAPGAASPARTASGTTSPPVAGATITLDVTPEGRDTVPGPLMSFGAPTAMGMSAVPDMHTALMQQQDGSYRLWVAGRFLNDSIEGATGLITTGDFQTFGPGPLTDATGKKTAPDFVPTCRGAIESTACWNNFDAVYAGADFVWRGTDGDLRMLYHGACGYFGGLPPDSSTATWCEVGVARSSDGGATWGSGVPVISGSEAKPTSDPIGIFGAVEPGAIIANGFLYCFYAYFALASPNQPVIQVARAPLAGNGAPGTWQKFYNDSFSQAGLLGGPGTTSLGAPIVPTIAGCTRPAQPWPVFSTYLNAWVLVFIGKEGWFFTTSSDLVDWNVPVRFFPFAGDPALTNFTNGAETYENVILVTPGNPEGVIGRDGVVLYAYTSSWGHNPHMLWSRPFHFDLTTAGVGPPQESRSACELEAVQPNPSRGRSAVAYRVAEPGPVRLEVCDLTGRRVLRLVDAERAAGAHTERFDSSRLAPGVYECRLSAGGVTRALKFVRLR